MEKYIEIINLIVTKHSDRPVIIKELKAIEDNPTNYIETCDRFLELTDDYMWLGLIDLLIAKNYAFEIDWKEYYNEVKSGIETLLSNWLVETEIENDDALYDMDAESFFPRINPLIKDTNCQIFNLDIDSDSYVTTMTTIFNENKLLLQDSRIKKY